jgi:hypothetical protein
MGTPWNDLTDDDRDAAVRIGYNSTSWEREYGHDDYDYNDAPTYSPTGDEEEGGPTPVVTPVEDYTHDGEVIVARTYSPTATPNAELAIA